VATGEGGVTIGAGVVMAAVPPCAGSLSSPLIYSARISSQFPEGVISPVYLLGRPTRSIAPRYGMLLRFKAFAGRTFDGRRVEAESFDEDKFANRDF